MKINQTAARKILIGAQGLDRRPSRPAGKDSLLDTIRRMGALQIDTIHVVARSPYLVLWSRLGSYQPHWLDELLAEGKLFEYWAHAACFLPIEDYPLYRNRMFERESMGWRSTNEWIAQHKKEAEMVLAHIRERGPLRSIDFTNKQAKGGGWWSWKPEKHALEILFNAGDLMIARRQKFQRVYDLRERVLPDWDDTRLPARAQ